MKDKYLEKKIISSLEDKGALSTRVLDEAKQEMDERKSSGKKPVWKFAFVALSAVVICLIIVLPVMLTKNRNGFIDTEYSAMYDFVTSEGIDVVPFSHLLDNSLGTQFEQPDAELYTATKCTLTKKKGRNVKIEETYNFAGGTDEITLSILLDNDEENALFSDFSDLKKTTRIYKTDIAYEYDENTHRGKATFVCNGYKIFVTVKTDSESTLLSHLQAFVIMQ